MSERKFRIGLVSILPESFLTDLVEVQSGLANVIHIIAPNFKPKKEGIVFFHKIRYKIGKNMFDQTFNQLSAQIVISYNIIKFNKKVDFWIFHGGDVLMLPMLTVKMLNSKAMLLMAGNLRKETELKKNALNVFQILFRTINCALTDGIILYSKQLIRQWELGKYEKKIVIADHHFVKLDIFNIQKRFCDRDNVVGYVGRLSPEKGIFNLIQAIPSILKGNPELKFIIVGDGPLKAEIVSFLHKHNLNDKVFLVGSVSHSEVPKYLNEFRLCVLPSYMEGMPNIMLEAMACGTPVLATRVGAISDIISHGNNGFLMENNSPESISEGILAAAGRIDLNKISSESRDTIEKQCSLESVRKKYLNAATDKFKSLTRNTA